MNLNQFTSNKAIFATTATLLFIATVLALVGIGLEVQHQAAGFPTALVGPGDSVTLYVTAGVMGAIPSPAGTLQSWALAIAYGVLPLVLTSMCILRMFASSHQKA